MITIFSLSTAPILGMKCWLIILFGSCGFFQIFGQNTYEPVSVQVQYARSATFEHIENDQFDSLEVYKLGRDGRYSFLAIDEEEKILLMSGRFDDLIRKIPVNERFTRKRDHRWFSYSTDSLKEEYRFIPYYDDLFERLIKIGSYDVERIDSLINRSSLDDENSKFLRIYLRMVATHHFDCIVLHEKEFISLSKQFLVDYPESIWIPFIRKYCGKEYYTSKSGLGFYLHSGLQFYSGNLGRHFSPSIPIHWGLTYNYSHIYIFLGMGFNLGTQIKEGLLDDDGILWQSGDQSFGGHAEILIGYDLLDSKRFAVTPLVGFSGTGFYPTGNSDPSYYDNVKGVFSPNNWALGLNLDFKWARNDRIPSCHFGDLIYGITRIQIVYNNPQFEQYSFGPTGSVWSFKIGIGLQNQLARISRFAK